MRIEKINDKQIRCTLNQKDLADRELQISELAYGSAKAKALFRDMMQQASYECGFETEDIPLMIEAIPLSPDTLILVVTKVEDPDELDARFSRFTENIDFDYDTEDYPFEEEFADTIDGEFSFGDVEELPYTGQTEDAQDFISLSEALGMEPRPASSHSTVQKPTAGVIKLFSFSSLQELSSLAAQISSSYHGDNQIYKDAKKGIYYLVLHQSGYNTKEFGHICNMTAEYGAALTNMYASYAYLDEHCIPLIRKNALQTLAGI